MPGVVGQEANLADAEVRDDLATEANLAKNTLVWSAEGLRFGATGGTVDAERGRMCGAVNREAALGVMEVDEGPDAGMGDLAEGGVDSGAAVAGCGTEDVAG